MNPSTPNKLLIPAVIVIVALIITVAVYYIGTHYGTSPFQKSGGTYTETVDGKTYQMQDYVPTYGQKGIRTNSTATSTDSNEPTPVITSISPSSGPVGTVIELKGNNLAGFEGELDAWIVNSNGEKAFLPGIGSVPRADGTIRVKIDSKLCKEDLSYKGGTCSSYLTITPGTYGIYTYPWGTQSNSVKFTITATSTVGWKTYTNTVYGYSFEHPSGVAIGCNGDGCYETKSDWIYSSAISVRVANNSSDIQSYAQGIWDMNKRSDSNFPNKLVGDISKIQFNGKTAYEFTATDAYDDLNGGFLLEENNTFLFVSNGKQNFVIWYPTTNQVSTQILSTFKFTN